MPTYSFYGFMAEDGVGKAGLTVTASIVNSSGAAQVTAQAATDITLGFYKYDFTTATAGDYLCVFATADTSVDSKNVPALTVNQISAFLDAQVSTLPALVWSVATRTLTSFGTLVTDIWTYVNRSLTTFGTLITDIIAAISGGGTTTFVYPVTNSVTGLPLEGVLVRVTTDIAGVNTIATRETDSFGNVTFYLNPGTYYFWSSKDGFNFTNPDTEVIT